MSTSGVQWQFNGITVELSSFPSSFSFVDGILECSLANFTGTIRLRPPECGLASSSGDGATSQVTEPKEPAAVEDSDVQMPDIEPEHPPPPLEAPAELEQEGKSDQGGNESASEEEAELEVPSPSGSPWTRVRARCEAISRTYPDLCYRSFEKMYEGQTMADSDEEEEARATAGGGSVVIDPVAKAEANKRARRSTKTGQRKYEENLAIAAGMMAAASATAATAATAAGGTGISGAAAQLPNRSILGVRSSSGENSRDGSSRSSSHSHSSNADATAAASDMDSRASTVSDAATIGPPAVAVGAGAAATAAVSMPESRSSHIANENLNDTGAFAHIGRHMEGCSQGSSSGESNNGGSSSIDISNEPPMWAQPSAGTTTAAAAGAADASAGALAAASAPVNRGKAKNGRTKRNSSSSSCAVYIRDSMGDRRRSSVGADGAAGAAGRRPAKRAKVHSTNTPLFLTTGPTGAALVRPSPMPQLPCPNAMANAVSKAQMSVLAVKGAPTARWGHTATLVSDDTLLVYGGQADEDAGQATLGHLDALSLSTRSWSRPLNGSSLPRTWHTATFVPERKELVVMGGERTVDGNVECVDASSMTVMVLDCSIMLWYPPECCGKAPMGRAGHSAALLGKEVVVFGGSRGRGKWHNGVAALDTTSWRWRAVSVAGEAPAPRSYHTATVVGERMVVLGGNNDKETFDRVAVMCAPQGKGWEWLWPEVMGNAPAPRTGHSAVLLADGRTILVYGGWDPQDDGVVCLSDSWLLDTELWEWWPGPNMTATIAASSADAAAAAAASSNSHGDKGEGGVDVRCAEEGGSDLPAMRVGMTGTLVPAPSGEKGGAIVYIGGQDGAGVRHADVRVLAL